MLLKILYLCNLFLALVFLVVLLSIKPCLAGEILEVKKCLVCSLKSQLENILPVE